MMDFGMTFAPTAQQQQTRPGGETPQGGTVQDAIQTLALRLPRFAGVRGIAPQGLLQAPGAAGLGLGGGMGQNPLLLLLQQLLGGGQALVPSVTPGVTPGGPPAPQMRPQAPAMGPQLPQANPATVQQWTQRGGVTGGHPPSGMPLWSRF